MDITEGQEQVIIVMSPEEYGEFRRTYSAAWFFIRDLVKNSVPEGRVYGQNAEQDETKQRPSASEAYGKPWDFLAVDWAKNQVERIDRVVEGLVERIDQMTPYVELAERVSRLENTRIRGDRVLERITALENGSRLVGTGGLIAEMMARLDGLENRLTRNPGDDMAEPLEEWTERQLDKMAAALRELENRLNAFVSTFDEMGDRVRRLESQTEFETSEDDARLRQLENALRDYGIPLGGRVTLSKTEAFARMYGASPTGRVYGRDFKGWAGPPFKSPATVHDETNTSYFNSGYKSGSGDALEAAEARVRKYMTGHWSEGSVEGVVHALHGDETYGGRLPLGHLFRFEAPDRRHCSWRSDPEDERCNRLASDH